MTRVSVALCVYNGARFLPEQLASIALQTHPVDELVVCDDCSTDNSLDLIEKFSKTVPFPVYIHRNKIQLGSTKNFEKCLQLCAGDILFLCDQDDVWHPERVAKQVQYLAKNPTMQAVFSNGDLINKDSEPLAGQMWDAIQFDEIAQQDWQQGEGYKMLFRGYVVTGATLAIRAVALPELVPFPDGIKTMIHDSWIALLLAMKNQIGFINEPLIQYRTHAGQQVGFGKAGRIISLQERFTRDRTKKLELIKKEWLHIDTMHQLLMNKPDLPADRMSVLVTLRDHLYTRLNLPNNRLLRIVPVCRQLFTGQYYYRQRQWWKTVLGDLLE